MSDFIRVRDKDTGHEYTIRERRFKDGAQTKLDKDAVGASGEPLPPKHKTTVTKAADKKAGTATKATDDKKES